MSGGFPPPPERPHEDECCHRGCDPCIFDYYERGLERWRERVLAAGGDPEALLARRAAGEEGPGRR